VTERAHERFKNRMEHCLKTDTEIGTSFVTTIKMPPAAGPAALTKCSAQVIPNLPLVLFSSHCLYTY
jgi:hypothetical protein